MNEWFLVYEDFNPEQEQLREALCTLGNGYFCTRGAAPQSEANGVHYPGTYLAGGYNRLKSDVAGEIIENEDLVNMPNWLPLTFRMDGGTWFDLRDVEILSYRQELDMERGLLLREFRFQDDKERTTAVSERRMVHLSQPHLAALEMTLVAEDWAGTMEIRTGLDGTVVNAGVERYLGLENRHLEPLETWEFNPEGISLKVRTVQSRLEVAQAARTRIMHDNELVQPERQRIERRGYIAQQFGIDVSEGGEIRVEKIVSLYTSRDTAISECGLEARKTVMDAGSFDDLLEPHTEDWAHLWRRFDVQFEHEDPEEGDYTEMVLHLHVFHLLQTTSTNTKDLDVGVPSRGWHGEAYRGHILWDELFIFPLLNLRIPAITHALLMYRFRRMNEARRLAREAGYCGAMYPWQSGSNGREESQEIHLNPESGRWIPDHSHLQRHVNAAIAYNTWQFYQVTGDKEFLSFYGSEMILEIARFWSAITTYNEELDRFEILGIMGPDEFHDGYPDTDKPGVDNNAYTNIMVVWVMCRACEILHDLLPEDRAAEICESLDIEEEEIQRWQEISRKMRIEFHDDGIISQFQGYGELKEFDWERYRRKYGNIQRLDRILEAEGDDVNCYKVSKQADVLMLFYLFSSEELKELFERLGYEFPKELIPRNVEYYQQRTSHGSTLSWVVDAWVMARQDRARSWHLFKDALKVDVEDIQGGTTPEGIHLGAMAGSVDLMKRGYTGLDPRGDILWINPRLPDEVKKLRMQIHYRGHSLILEITPKQLRINAYRAAEAPITIGFKGKKHELTAGEVMELSLEKS